MMKLQVQERMRCVNFAHFVDSNENFSVCPLWISPMQAFNSFLANRLLESAILLVAGLNPGLVHN
jgi:hypothetical protein